VGSLRLGGVVAVVLLAGMLAGGWVRDPFEGNWKITATPEGDGKEFKDTLIFKGQKLTVVELAKKGWEPAEYDEDTRRNGPAKFNSVLRHGDGSVMKWEGLVSASSIRGTIVWTKKGGGEERYSFSGER
jgi:hypothetical protein